jgi:hypothetical protein
VPNTPGAQKRIFAVRCEAMAHDKAELGQMAHQTSPALHHSHRCAYINISGSSPPQTLALASHPAQPAPYPSSRCLLFSLLSLPPRRRLPSSYHSPVPAALSPNPCSLHCVSDRSGEAGAGSGGATRLTHPPPHTAAARPPPSQGPAGGAPPSRLALWRPGSGGVGARSSVACVTPSSMVRGSMAPSLCSMSR